MIFRPPTGIENIARAKRSIPTLREMAEPGNMIVTGLLLPVN